MRKFNFFIAVVFILSSLSGFAASVPNCWDNPDAVPRTYLLSIDRSKETPAKTFKTLEDLGHTRYLRAGGYPIFLGEFIFVDTSAPSPQYGPNNQELSDTQLRHAVEGELLKLLEEHSLQIECNSYVYPQG